MAAEDELWQDDQLAVDGLVAHIISIQAWVKGVMVRKQMKEIRGLYEDIVRDLDGPDMEVVWSRDLVSRPSVRKVQNVGPKVAQRCMDRESCSQTSNQRQVPSGSVQSETKKQSSVSFVSIGTSTDVPLKQHQVPLTQREVPLRQREVPCQTCAVLQTRSIGAEVQYPHNTGAEVQYPHSTGTEVHYPHSTGAEVQNPHSAGADQCKQIGEPESLVAITARLPPVMEIETACSSTQTQESELYVLQTQESELYVLQTQDMLGQCRTLMSAHADGTQHDQVSEVLNKNICVSCQLLPADVPEPGPRLETLPADVPELGPRPEKLPADVLEHDPRLQKACWPTVGHKLSTAEPHIGRTSTAQTTGNTSGDVEAVHLPGDKKELLQLKHTVAMELLWVQQAIASRKHYLRLKEQLQ
ncbi:hypothetical protein BsWGS_14503 [Bradybaena similaris]